MNLDSRRYVILTFMILIGVIYTFRLFQMQVIDDSWKIRAQEIAEKRRFITPPRAVLFDRNMKKVVTNKAYYNLMFVEDDIEKLDTIAFGKLIGMTVEEVRNRFAEIRYREGKYKRKDGTYVPNYQSIRPYPFLKELTNDEISMIAPHLDEFPGFYEQVTSMRNYPYSGGANILGYIQETNAEEIKADKYYRSGDNIGRTGVERYYESQLRGQKGVHYIVTSAMNNALEAYENGKYDTLAVQAPALTLGMDIDLQVYGEQLMQNKRGCIVAIEPSTGEILAMVSSPSYDPNLFVGRSNISKNYMKLLTDPDKPLFPRPLAAEYPPGSIFKLINALIGMQEGVIDENASFPCNKSLVGCHNHPQATSVARGVQMSCNPYFYAVTRRILQQGKSKNVFADAEQGLAKWNKYMYSFGLGQKLETDVTGLRPGLIPTPEFYDKWYGHHGWAFSTIRSISIGQGEVKLTPLQMANVAVIMANRGWFITPHIVKSVGEDGPLEQFKYKHQTMVDAKFFAPITEGMRMAVNEGGGTARRARIDNMIVCGKTGTAQNPHGEDHSVFIAFAPMNNPKIAIAVFIENAGFGGTWAAPIASLMIEKYTRGKIADKEKEKRILEAIIKG